MESLNKRDVFELTDLPKGHKTIGCRWVFNVKGDGRKKARLVAQGFSQVEGVDYDELFSPVVQFENVCLMLALAALHNWYMTGETSAQLIFTESLMRKYTCVNLKAS